METDKITRMMMLVPGWKLLRNGTKKIERCYKFKDFAKALQFVNRVGELAEEEDHHPDILIHYNEVTLTFWTHAIKGLFDNDFIMAAKADKLLAE
ncbi:MAG: 4a-hydroxytetrahydrobiopterin dehydratase [Candidatus Thorarchaeota archaeon]|jgi:4a-hydroxytetrahydrobiopterin dehydratase